MKAIFGLLVLSIGTLILTSCASSTKARQEARDKAAISSGLYCEFVSGDEYEDVDVEVSLRMSKKCDSNKPFNLTNYKNSSENFGLVYCCSMKGATSSASNGVSASPAATKAEKTVALPAAPDAKAPTKGSNKAEGASTDIAE